MSEQIPATWSVEPLVNLVDPARPVTYGVVQPGERLKNGIPIIRGQDYSGGDVDDSDLYLIHPSIAESYRRSTVKGGDILFSIVGYLGQVALVPHHLGGANITQTTARIAIRPPNSARFFVQQFRTDLFAPEIRKYQKGSAQPGLNLSDVERFRVTVPTPNEQSRIAEILDILDAALREAEAVVAKLRQVKAGLHLDLLTFGLDEHGQPRNPARYPEQFQDSPIGLIPKAWQAPTIGEIASHVRSGATPTGGSEVYRKEGITFVRSQNVTLNGLLLDDVVFITPATHAAMSRSEIFAFDVLLNITGASIGRCCYVPGGFPAANVNQHVCALRLTKPSFEDGVFLTSVLASHIGQSQIDRLNAGGNREGLNYTQVRSFVVPWPEPEERKAIANRIEVGKVRLQAEELKLSKLQSLKRGLAHDLLTGRVRVKPTTN